MMGKDIFILDSNIFIQPKNLYYPFDFAPGFWQQLKKHIESGKIAILDMVMKELESGGDDVHKWLNGIKIPLLVNCKDASIINKYGEVIRNVSSNSCYQKTAFEEWARDTVADPWLIAAAAVNKYVLITMEKPAPNLSPKTPCKNAKIPDVANCFNVKTDNLFNMMRELNFILR